MQDLILLHGALGSKEQFSELFKHLETNFNVHRLNFDGHGGGNIPPKFSIELFAENSFQFIKENKVENSFVFGYSMGGYVALKLAVQFPEIFKKIMTLGTKFAWSPEAAKKEIKILNPDLIEIKIPHFADMLRKRHSPSDWKIVMERTAEMMKDLGNGKAIKQENYCKIKIPVLITIGSEDKMVTINESKNTAEKLFNGKCKVINGFLHPIEMVEPAALAKEMIDFFEK